MSDAAEALSGENRIMPEHEWVPLAVDLDGTLIKSDCFLESLLGLLKVNFLWLFVVPGWLARGKAYLKQQIAERVTLNPKLLPYQTDFLEFLKEERAKGRELVLATAAYRNHAESIADYLGIFDKVIATEYPENLSGERKLRRLLDLYGDKGFDYAGNARVDLRIWPWARAGIVVNPESGVLNPARKETQVLEVFRDSTGGLPAYIKAIRIHQWVKNVLIFVPLLSGHLVFDHTALINSLAAFVAFGLAASSAYVLNDLFDLEADRAHPRKRKRPFASGRLSIFHGLILAPALLLMAAAIATMLPTYFGWVLAVYYVTTLLYTFKLKRYATLDILALAGLYTLRIIAGAAAIGIMPSFWLLAFSMFVFLSLAQIKRSSELLTLQREGRIDVAGRGYIIDDLAVVMASGLASGYAAVLVLALYINSPQIQVLYKHAEFVWLLCPLMLYWINRMWMITHRGDMHDDPIVFAFRDRTGLLLGFLAAIVLLLAI
jgi:4-hydroxybenzoate polyprenyltransferase